MIVFTTQLAILALVIIANTILSITVYMRNQSSATNKSFLAFGVIATVWLLASYQSAIPETNLFWSRLTIFFASLMTAALFIFAHTVPRMRFALNKRQTALITLATASVMIIALSPYAFSGIDRTEGIPRLITEPGMAAFGIFTVCMTLATLRVLFKKIKRLSGTEKEQVRFVLIGILFMHGFLITTIMLPVAIFQEDAFVPLMPLYTFVLLGMSAYAIIRYRFLDIRLIVARSVSFAFMILITAGAYAFIILFVARTLFAPTIDSELAVLLFIPLVLGMLSFQTLQKIVRRFTDRLLFKGEYDSDRLISELTHTMAQTIDLDTLCRDILQTIIAEMRITKAGFLLVSQHRITNFVASGYRDHALTSPELEALLHHAPPGGSHMFSFDEFSDENPVKTIFRSLGIALAIPIRVEKEEVAILVLGPKASGETYYDRDMRVLDIFANEAGIAIENAKSYTELRRFSRELEKRVRERTKELETAQKQELVKAEEINRLKDEFVFLAAHELRTPVTAIRGFLELTAEAEKNFPQDIRHNISAISQAADHLNQLINDLLEIARSEGGKMIITVSPNPLRPIIEEMLNELAPLMKEKGISAKTDFKPLPPVLCDAVKTKEVLANIIGNAIKYNKENGSIAISVFRHPEEHAAIVEIRDTGYGIPAADQPKIFQKFFRANAQGTQTVLGTGLGLFIARMLVEKMNGAISFSSAEGRGATFAFTLPLAPEDT